MEVAKDFKEGKLVRVLYCNGDRSTEFHQSPYLGPQAAYQQRPQGLIRLLHSAFLPDGFPESVSSDFSSRVQSYEQRVEHWGTGAQATTIAVRAQRRGD
jgi:hypothetical protein